jgi:ABC-2 type transport system ATP-binding protein
MTASGRDDPSPSPSPSPDQAAAFEAVLAPLREGRKEPLPIANPPSDHVARQGEPVLAVQGLSKSFDGQKVLDSLSFSVFPGQILGLLGPIGAGKTTCLRVLATLLNPDSGSGKIAGQDLKDFARVRARIGYLPDILGTYDDLYVFEYLEFFARAYGVKPDQRKAALDQALLTSGLADLRDKRLPELSLEQKQKLALARLLMHGPAVLLLDEPLAGLGPGARLEVVEILRGLSRGGTAIVISSADLEEVMDLADSLAVLDQGRLLTLTSTAELVKRLRESRRWRLRLREQEDAERLSRFLQEQPDAGQVIGLDREVWVTLQGDEQVVESLHERLFEAGFRLLEFAQEPLTPEELHQRIAG